MRAQIETEGEAEGLRLLDHLRRQLEEMRLMGPVESAKELARRTHPSRMVGWSDLEPLITKWAADPSSILPDLEQAEREREDKSRQAAFADALRRAKATAHGEDFPS